MSDVAERPAGIAGSRLEALRARARAELERREELKRHKAECEESLEAFVVHFGPVVEPMTPLIAGWPLTLICDILTSITDGHSTRDIINVPPGWTKSYL